MRHRKTIRLPGNRYVGCNSYFVTVCTEDRKRHFEDAILVQLLLTVLKTKCTANGFGVDAFCFMPDHVHLLLSGLNNNADLHEVMRSFKGAAVAQARAQGIHKLWQKGFYDHIIRTGEDLIAVACYIWENPVRVGLIRDPMEWPFSGSWMMNWRELSAPAVPFKPPWK